MNRKSFLRGLTVLAFFASPAYAQPSHTMFIPGFGAGPDWWTRQNTIGRLSQQVNLVDPVTPNVGSQAAYAVDDQAYYLRLYIDNYGGTSALVGHSLGGLVARRAWMANSASIYGFLTVGTPNSGAMVADSIAKLRSLITYAAAAVSDAAGRLGVPARYRPTAVLNGSMGNLLQANSSPAMTDARTTSWPVYANRTTPDNLPHAAVYGQLDKTYAWMRVANGALNGTNNNVGTWQSEWNAAMSVLKGCQAMRRFLIPAISLEKSCGKAYNAMHVFSGYWTQYTSAGAASDGFIPNTSSAYPGTTLADNVTNKKVLGVDHNSLISHQLGIDAMGAQLRTRLGYFPP